MTVDGLRRCIRALSAPDHLFSWDEIRDRPDLPPKASGLYAWYFDRQLRGIPREGCQTVAERDLLYVGISPSRSGSRATLRSRLRYHFKGNASGSTLRFTLACLLRDEIGHALAKRRGRVRLSDAGEYALSSWLHRHARVCWVTHPTPWRVEPGLIQALSLPLNLAHNEGHSFHSTLRQLRREARAHARLDQATH